MEVVLNPVENYDKTILFQTPIVDSNETPYTNYANVIANISDSNHTFVDGNPITGYSYFHLDNKYRSYLIPKIGPGAHVVTSDSGVGVYLYGYGKAEAYAWPGALG